MSSDKRRTIFSRVYEYRLSIIFFVILSTSSMALWLYLQPDIYETSTTIEVGVGSSHSRDAFTTQTNEGTSINTQIGIIKSRFLATQALQKVDLTHRYFVKREMRKKELYKNIPFELNLTKGKQILFHLYPINEESYRLRVDDGSIDYDQVVDYGKEVKNDIFQLKIQRKKNINMSENSYQFILLPDSVAIKYAVENTRVSQWMPNASLLKITYQDTNSLRAKEYADALASSYIEQSIYQKREDFSKTLNFVDKQLLEINNSLQSFAQELEKFKLKTNTVSLDEKAKSIEEIIGTNRMNLSQLSVQEELLHALYQQIKSGENLEILSLVGLGDDNAHESSIPSLVKNMQTSVLKMKLLRADYTKDYPEVKKLQQQINQLKSIIINTIKSMKRNITNRKLLVEKSIKKEEKILQKLPKNEREYERIKQKFVLNEKIYSYLLEQRFAIAIAKESTVRKNRILDRAFQPTDRVNPYKQKTLLMALIFGLLLGICYAFLRAFLNNKIT